MTKHFQFKRLIDKYSVPFTVQRSSEGYYDEDTGEYVEGINESIEMKGAIVPIKSGQIYNSGGRLTFDDRILYVLEPLEFKTRILYNGKTYFVEEAEDFFAYTDFHYYILKAVSSFAGTEQHPHSPY